MHTIAAISTPNAVGGIAMIRISGDNATGVAERIFKPFGKKLSDMEGYTCCYGIAHDDGRRLDDCILTVFKAPHSYTGEDVVEISCHGGLLVSREILRTALKNGAENAEAGEFTKRAFMNGKLDLTQAEAVMDIISAKSDLELKIAGELREGAAFKKARQCSESLMKILGDLAAWADYPEEDIPEVEPDKLAEELKTVRNSLFSLVENYDAGRILREGVSTVIVGKPNVGKSTLFNCLAGCERSIVTDISGTTRDVVEESVRIGDIVLRLSDTAGIHETDDVIEGIGIGIAEKMINSSELIIAVFDGSCPCTADDLNLIDKIKNKKAVAVINKSDAEQLFDTEKIKGNNIPIVYISAKENNINELNNAVQNLFRLNSDIFSSVPAANERQKRCIEKALECTHNAVNMLKNGEFLDAVTVVIDEAEQYLLELTGEKVTDAVVDEVFSRFCVGK
ncbi:MAG: tRNA uridine-5-carboxymethylaminomethyl(34) synthesis GTPase MnmE [Ruminococcus sp.]|nr:tRNA uridine-5-carboxymethylaminomethyl(34) synthesis GTPase MnmE [Ruminococcus sp.]